MIKKAVVILLFAQFVSSFTFAGQEVEYEADGVALKGYLELPLNAKGKVPGVLVIHEWWGHNDYARKRAKMVADLGYAAFALDMYGQGKVALDPKMAGQFANEVFTSGHLQSRFEAALNVLKSNPLVDSTKLAAIGYCFGGGVALRMALLHEPLLGVASFHGSLPSKEEFKGATPTKILILHGAKDQFVSTEQVSEFKKELEKNKIDYKFISYPGAPHAFTDPDSTKRGKMHNIPVGYNKPADEKSWKELQNFLKQIFK